MNMKKKLCAALSALCLAEAAFAAAAVSYTFNPSDKTAGFAPTNAYLWAEGEGAYWGGSDCPDEIGDAADLSSSTLSALSNPTFLMLPSEGIDIGGIQGRGGAPASVPQLHNALGQHSIGNLQEAGNICTGNIIAFHTVFLGSLLQIMENTNHNFL